MSLFSATSRDKLLSLINASNPTIPVPVSADNLYFGRPRQSSDNSKTILPCVAFLGSDYEGYVTFEYKRLNLTAAFGDTVPAITSVGATSLHGMLDVVNKVFGLDFTPEDVEDVSVADLGAGAQTNIRVRSLTTSPGYRGEFIFKFSRLRPAMSQVIATVKLNVLQHFKTTQDGKLSLEQQMWDFDFTPYKEHLGTYLGEWADLAGLRTVMQSFGFSTWPASGLFTLGNYPTASVATANKKYDRVIIQPFMTIDGYSGRGFIHYDNVLT